MNDQSQIKLQLLYNKYNYSYTTEYSPYQYVDLINMGIPHKINQEITCPSLNMVIFGVLVYDNESNQPAKY